MESWQKAVAFSKLLQKAARPHRRVRGAVAPSMSRRPVQHVIAISRKLFSLPWLGVSCRLPAEVRRVAKVRRRRQPVCGRRALRRRKQHPLADFLRLAWGTTPFLAMRIPQHLSGLPDPVDCSHRVKRTRENHRQPYIGGLRYEGPG